MIESSLQAFSFYAAANSESQQRLAAAAQHVHLAAGSVFYRAGDLCGHVGLVCRGDIRVFVTASNGREMTLYHVRDGEPCLINMVCVFLGREAMASAFVEESTDALVVAAVVFRRLIATCDTLRRFVFETMAARLVDVIMLSEEIAVRRVDERLAALLLREFHLHDEVTSTHQELAAELGTAREVVSRILKEFERIGGIRLGRGRIAPVDLRVLHTRTPRE